MTAALELGSERPEILDRALLTETLLPEAQRAPAVKRAVGSGAAMARFLGTSSPNTMDNDVAMTRARTNEMAPLNRAAQPDGQPSSNCQESFKMCIDIS